MTRLNLNLLFQIEGSCLSTLAIWAFFCCNWCSFTPLSAQSSPHPAFRQYTTDDGLASSETYCILQDRQDCLNSIQNYILQNEKESAILYLGRFASLVRRVLNASVAGKISLEEELSLLNNYLALEKLRFKDRFTYEVKVAKNLPVFDVYIPPLLIQPYVENALLHGISGKQSGGKVSVFFEKKANYLQVSIQDNGVGLNEKRAGAKNAKTHKSFGMSITRNRLELLANKLENEAVHTRTIFDEHGQACGTKVTLLIGLKQEFFETTLNPEK